MGLSNVDEDDKLFSEEAKTLANMGVSVGKKHLTYEEHYGTSNIKRKANNKIAIKHINIEDDLEVLKITTDGFINGELQHNMPCPVCITNRARYVNTGKDHYFSPCDKCESEGYIIKRKRWGL